MIAACCVAAAVLRNWTASGLIGYAVTEFGPKYQDVDQAITRYKNRDFDGAREFLVRAKQKNPELPPADVMLAKLHFAAKQVAAGRSALERAVRDDPKDPEAFLVLARAVERRRTFDRGRYALHSRRGQQPGHSTTARSGSDTTSCGY